MKIISSNFACKLTLLLSLVALSACLSEEKTLLGTPDGNAPDSGQDRPPVISGNPPNAVTIGTTYSFTPSASDPDGDPLTFSISNKPSWADFDSTTGTLSGTPSLVNMGSYADIVISVSANSLTASLSPFPVDVVQASLGSISLSWTPPTQNADGSSLDDLVAYKIYYGTESGQYSNSVRIDSPGIASYVIENLVPDTYYFAATAINTLGIESRFSVEAIAQVL